MSKADEIIRSLELKPHPEGGFYRETYRAIEHTADLPARYKGKARAHSTAIYYLLTPDTFSAIHRVASDEIFHFYLGDTVEMLILRNDGRTEVVKIGKNLEAGEMPQVIVAKSWWQGCRLVDGGEFALMGCTVAPGFDFEDFEIGKRDVLQKEFPTASEMIAKLTR